MLGRNVQRVAGPGYDAKIGPMKISIIIPTLGRPSLDRTIKSIRGQLRDGDEVLIVSDGPRPEAQALALSAGASFRFFEGPLTRKWGHAQRMLGMKEAVGDYLAFMDDDDIYLPGALDSMRRGIEETGAGLLLFRMIYYSRVLWDRPLIVYGNVSTQMVVVRNDPERLGAWAPRLDTPEGEGADFIFISDTASRGPSDSVVFRPEVISELTCHSRGQL